MADYRTCARCKLEKPAGLFYSSRAKKWCKACTRDYQREYMRAKRGSAIRPVVPVVDTPTPQFPNFTRQATEHEREMLEIGEAIARQCPNSFHALQVITDGWWEMNRRA